MQSYVVRKLFFIMVISCSMVVVGKCQAEDKTKDIQANSITLKVPESWKSLEVSNNFRIAELQVPAVEGDTDGGEVAVFPPMGGSADDNIKRWISQFGGSPSTKITTGKATNGSYYFVDITGTYKKSVGPPIMRKTEDKADYRMLAVILEVMNKDTKKPENYFLRLTGPKKTVENAVKDFRSSFGGDASTEKEYELK